MLRKLENYKFYPYKYMYNQPLQKENIFEDSVRQYDHQDYYLNYESVSNPETLNNPNQAYIDPNFVMLSRQAWQPPANKPWYNQTPKQCTKTNPCTKICYQADSNKCNNPCNIRIPVKVPVPCPIRLPIATWRIKYLVSNQANQAAHQDPDLVNCWGAVLIGNQIWIGNNMSDTITTYDFYGNKLQGSVCIRSPNALPSYVGGLVANTTGGFPITDHSYVATSTFITCTQTGHILSYNQAVSNLKTIVSVITPVGGHTTMYTGLTIANNRLYVTDFFGKDIHVFDSNYNTLSGFPFVDGDLDDPIPSDFSPSNIFNIGCYLFVLYCQQDPQIPFQYFYGPGHGYINIFKLDGSFVKRFVSRGHLNTPWGFIPAPKICGLPPNSFLVGNDGDGRINVYDYQGKWHGPLLSRGGLPIEIVGLHELVTHYGAHNEIFFTSSEDELTTGLFGSLVLDQLL